MRSLGGGAHLPVLFLMLIAAVPPRLSPVDASIEHLRQAVTPQADGRHLLFLSALRQLHDPTLRSFFLQLAQKGDRGSQIHAILGLAEIDPSGHVDPWLISQLDDAEARYMVIDNALQLELMDTPQIKELLGWDDLEPRSRIRLMAELLKRGEPVDQEALAGLAEQRQMDVAGAASVLLAQLGARSAFSAFESRMAALPATERALAARALLATIREYELTEMLDWVVNLVQQPDQDELVVSEGVSVVLELDPGRGVALWTRALGVDPPYGKAFKFGLLLLEAAPGVGAAAFQRIPGDEPVLEAMARAGRAVCTGEETASTLIDLLDVGHPATTAWVMGAAQDLDDKQAARIYAHVIDTLGHLDPRQRDSAVVLLAAARLFDIDPDAVVERLDRAEDDGFLQQTILTALLETDSPAAGDAARRVRRIGYGPADSLATTLVAKHTEQLPPEELERLGVLASGGGRISESIRTQAAWLYVKHTANVERALAATFADDPRTP